VHHLDFLGRGLGHSRHRERQIARKQQGGNPLLQFAPHLSCGGLPCYLLLLLSAAQCRANLARRPLDAVDRKVNLHRDGRSQMLRYLITAIRLGFKQELIDDDGGVFLRSQLGARLLKS
jgi:hypothetical protein